MRWRSLIAASVTGPRFCRMARSTIAVTAKRPFVVSLMWFAFEYPIKMLKYTESRLKPSSFNYLIALMFFSVPRSRRDRRCSSSCVYSTSAWMALALGSSSSVPTA